MSYDGQRISRSLTTPGRMVGNVQQVLRGLRGEPGPAGTSGDWVVNDPEAVGYIQNRPGGYETAQETICGATTFTTVDGYMFPLLSRAPVEGNSYTVHLDNVEYECTATIGDGRMYIGNGYLMDTGEIDTGEPFVIYANVDYSPMYAVVNVQNKHCATCEVRLEDAEGVLLEETLVFMFKNGLANQIIPLQQEMQAGKGYLLQADGAYYACIAQEINGAVRIMIDGNTDNEINALACGEYMIFSHKVDGEHSASVTGPIECFHTDTVTQDNQDGSSMYTLLEGRRYQVIWDGVIYPCETVLRDGGICVLLGNLSKYYDEADTGEPFIMYSYKGYDGMYIDVVDSTDTEPHHFSLYASAAARIPPHYIQGEMSLVDNSERPAASGAVKRALAQKLNYYAGTNNNGKIATVVNGYWKANTPAEMLQAQTDGQKALVREGLGIPAWTEADNGKVLGVVDGALQWVSAAQ